MKHYAVIGYPVTYSVSPLMHNAAFEYLKIPAIYEHCPIKPSELDQKISFLKENYDGFNITIPLKELMLAYVNDVSEEVNEIGAMNTAMILNDEIYGYNTDPYGFSEGFKFHSGQTLSGISAIVLGSGGASKSVVYQLAYEKALKVTVVARNESKSKNLIKNFNRYFPDVEFKAISEAHLQDISVKDYQLLVNTTPVGMHSEKQVPFGWSQFHSNLWVYDLIYVPGETQLLAHAKKKSAKILNGLNMLLYQGAKSFEIWFDAKPPIDLMRETLTKAVYS